VNRPQAGRPTIQFPVEEGDLYLFQNTQISAEIYPACFSMGTRTRGQRKTEMFFASGKEAGVCIDHSPQPSAWVSNLSMAKATSAITS